MWTIPYLVSVLCMQWLADDQIKYYKQELEENEMALSLEREALQGLLPSSPGKWLIIISGN